MLSTIEIHPNIPQFSGLELDGGNSNRLAFEYSSLGFSTFMQAIDVNRLEAKWLNFWRGLFGAVSHLHSKGLVHGRITPSNLLFKRGTMMVKLYGLENCQKLTDELKDRDMVQLGMLMVHSFSRPLPTYDEESYLGETNPDCYKIPITALEARNVACMLVDRQGYSELRLSDVLVSPAWWMAAKRLYYFKRVSDIIEMQLPGLNAAIDGLRNNCWDAHIMDYCPRLRRLKARGWNKSLDVPLVRMKQYRK